MSALENLASNMSQRIEDLANVIRAHDTVHPDRSICGGLGRCILMRTEHEAGEELIDAVGLTARRGLMVTVAVKTALFAAEEASTR